MPVTAADIAGHAVDAPTLILVSPVSTSVSLVSTLPVAFEPGRAVGVPPASVRRIACRWCRPRHRRVVGAVDGDGEHRGVGQLPASVTV